VSCIAHLRSRTRGSLLFSCRKRASASVGVGRPLRTRWKRPRARDRLLCRSRVRRKGASGVRFCLFSRAGATRRNWGRSTMSLSDGVTAGSDDAPAFQIELKTGPRMEHHVGLRRRRGSGGGVAGPSLDDAEALLSRGDDVAWAAARLQDPRPVTKTLARAADPATPEPTLGDVEGSRNPSSACSPRLQRRPRLAERSSREGERGRDLARQAAAVSRGRLIGASAVLGSRECPTPWPCRAHAARCARIGGGAALAGSSRSGARRMRSSHHERRRGRRHQG
jgi:hypothetical protein